MMNSEAVKGEENPRVLPQKEGSVWACLRVEVLNPPGFSSSAQKLACKRLCFLITIRVLPRCFLYNFLCKIIIREIFFLFVFGSIFSLFNVDLSLVISY